MSGLGDKLKNVTDTTNIFNDLQKETEKKETMNIVEKIAKDFEKGMSSNEIMESLKQDDEVLQSVLSPIEKIVAELETIKKQEKARFEAKAKQAADDEDYSEAVREVFDGYKSEIDEFISENCSSPHYSIMHTPESFSDTAMMNILAMGQRKAKKDNIMLLAYRYSNNCNYDDLACIFTSKEILGFVDEELQFSIGYNEIDSAVFSKAKSTITIDTIDQDSVEINFPLDSSKRYISSVAFLYNILMDVVDAVNN